MELREHRDGFMRYAGRLLVRRCRRSRKSEPRTIYIFSANLDRREACFRYLKSERLLEGIVVISGERKPLVDRSYLERVLFFDVDKAFERYRSMRRAS